MFIFYSIEILNILCLINIVNQYSIFHHIKNINKQPRIFIGSRSQKHNDFNYGCTITTFLRSMSPINDAYDYNALTWMKNKDRERKRESERGREGEIVIKEKSLHRFPRDRWRFFTRAYNQHDVIVLLLLHAVVSLLLEGGLRGGRRHVHVNIISGRIYHSVGWRRWKFPTTVMYDPLAHRRRPVRTTGDDGVRCDGGENRQGWNFAHVARVTPLALCPAARVTSRPARVPCHPAGEWNIFGVTRADRVSRSAAGA